MILERKSLRKCQECGVKYTPDYSEQIWCKQCNVYANILLNWQTLLYQRWGVLSS